MLGGTERLHDSLRKEPEAVESIVFTYDHDSGRLIAPMIAYTHEAELEKIPDQ